MSCLAYLSANERKKIVEDSLCEIRKIDHLATRADAFIALIPHLTDKHEQDTVIGEALDALRNYGTHTPVSIILFSALSPYLHSNLYRDAATFSNEFSHTRYHVLAKIVLARNLPDEEQSKLFKEAIHIACEDDAVLNSTFEVFVPYLAAWAMQQRVAGYNLFTENLRNIAAKPRSEFLWNLGDLMPFTLALAGDEAPQAAAGIFQAIQEVCGWWP